MVKARLRQDYGKLKARTCKVRARSRQGHGNVTAKSSQGHGKFKARSRQCQVKVKARSRQGQGKVKARLGQGKGKVIKERSRHSQERSKEGQSKFRESSRQTWKLWWILGTGFPVGIWLGSRILVMIPVLVKQYYHRQKAYCLTKLIPILSAIYFLINKNLLGASRFLVQFTMLYTNCIILD